MRLRWNSPGGTASCLVPLVVGCKLYPVKRPQASREGVSRNDVKTFRRVLYESNYGSNCGSHHFCHRRVHHRGTTQKHGGAPQAYCINAESYRCGVNGRVRHTNSRPCGVLVRFKCAEASLRALLWKPRLV